jgi:sporulation protein YlmC with PRC-barrel domain
MSRKFLLLAALPFLVSGPAFAQSADEAPAATETPAPPPADPDDGSATTGAAESSGDMTTTGSADTPGTVTTEGTAAAAGDAQILTEESQDQVLADRLVGMKVVDMAGNEVGEVEDILLDKSGQVAGLVLSHGKVLGMGGKTVAISWQDIATAEDSDAITVNLTEEQLAAAPEFRTKEELEQEQFEDTAPAAGGSATTPAEPAPAEQQ